MIDQALWVVTGTLQGLADEVGVFYATIRSWAEGRSATHPRRTSQLSRTLSSAAGAS